MGLQRICLLKWFEEDCKGFANENMSEEDYKAIAYKIYIEWNYKGIAYESIFERDCNGFVYKTFLKGIAKSSPIPLRGRSKSIVSDRKGGGGNALWSLASSNPSTPQPANV